MIYFPPFCVKLVRTTRVRRAGRHRGGSPVLLSRQCSVPKLSDRRIGRPQSDLSDLFRPAVSQGARETPWEEGRCVTVLPII